MAQSDLALRRFGLVPAIYEFVLIVAALAYVISGTIEMLIWWEALAVAYLVIGGIRVWTVAHRDPVQRKLGRLDAATWVLPLIASSLGISSAFIASQAITAAKQDYDMWVYAMFAAFAIVLSWLFMHVGFAYFYHYLYWRRPDGPP